MMKHLFRVLAFLLLFASCQGHRRDAKRMVRRAEMMVETQSDSTVILIDSVLRMEVYFGERSRMEMALLQGDALFRDVSVEDEDIEAVLSRFSPSPELERAASYYSRKKEYSKAARAALYSGYVQQYYHDNTTAMQSFKDAERFGALADENLVVARARCRMGKMLYNDYMEEEALAMFTLAETGFLDHNEERALVLNMMAAPNIVLHQNDSAEACLRRSCYYAEQSHCKKAKVKVLNNFSILYRQRKEYDRALISLRNLKQLVEKPVVDSAGLLMCYLNTCNVFMSSGDMDSANYYCQRMEEVLPSVKVSKETLFLAYGAIIKVAKFYDNDSLAFRYQEKHENVLYEVMRQRQSQTVFRIQKQYDYEHLQNMMNMKLAHIQWVVVIVLILVFVIIVFFLYRSAQRNKREAEINANLFHFMHENEELLLRHEAQKKESIEKSQQLSDMLLERIHIMQRLDYYLNNQGDKRSLREVEKLLFDGKTHNEAIMEVMDVLYPGLRDTVKAKYPQMSELECEVYLLSRYKLSRIEEATLLGISTSVLDKARGKVHKWISEGQE